MTPRELVDQAVVAYVRGGMPALQAMTGPDPVESPVFWEAVTRIGATRRQLALGRIPRGVTGKRDWTDFESEQQSADDRHEHRGGNL